MFDLNKIENPQFIQKLTIKEMKILSEEIRTFLIENISKTGGHLASNLGVVELTIAMHYVFNDTNDKFIFDVGHQSYVHKILTGRAKDFSTLRKFGGLSGYASVKESKYDVWESGHSSNSISAMSGFLLSKDKGAPINNVVSVIGDSSIANGMAFEALNFLGNHQDKNPIIILNDNKMGISKSVGAFAKMLSSLRGTKVWRGFKRFLNAIFPTFITNTFHQIKRGFKGFAQVDNVFEDMGFDYFGPIDGNDISDVIKALEKAKKMGTPCLIHLLTKKGYGYTPAETDEVGHYHGVSPFDIKTGKPLNVNTNPNISSYSKIVSDILVQKRKEKDFFVVCPAMQVGMNLKEFSEEFKNDFFDVGIAEEHAATMAAGIAINKKDVVLLMYSTFAQRAYDQILNDICRQNLKVIIGIDRAGVVGEDGSTHQGIYDVAMFNHMPNIKICMPRNAMETQMLFNYAFEQDSPIVIRYPRGNDNIENYYVTNEKLDMNWEIVNDGAKAVVITYGPDVDKVLEVVKKNNLDVMVVNARFIKPIDENIVRKIIDYDMPILIYEQVVSIGALSSSILNFAYNNDLVIKKMHTMGFNCDQIIEHGSIEKVLNAYEMDCNAILKEINKLI